MVRKRQDSRGVELEGTKAAIVDAALETLKSVGYSRASARAIARTGRFNQALIFYHFGSVDRLLLAALDETSTARMDRYRRAVRDARTLPELIQVAKRNYREDLEGGHMTVVAELVAGSVADPGLRPEIALRMRDWVEFVEEVLNRFLEHSPLKGLVPTRDAAFAVVSFYLGLNISARLDENQMWVENLFSALEGASPFLATLTPGP